jgi:hypothetical protein
VIETQFFLAGKTCLNHRRHRQWSVYTALPFRSSSSAPEAPELRAHLRLKSFGLDSVPDAGNWRGMADGCGCKGMVAIAGQGAACVRDG